MGKPGRPRKDQTQTIEIKVPKGDIEPDDPDEDQDSDEIRALADLDDYSDVRWQISRVANVGNGRKPLGYCTEYTTGEVSQGRIAEDLGSGKYRVKAVRANGQYVKMLTVTIAHEKSQAPQSPATGAPGPGNMSMLDFLALMEEREQRRSKQNVEMLTALSPILAPLVANLFGSQKGPSLTELTSALTNMKSLTTPDSKMSQLEEFTKMLALVREVKEDSAPEAVGSTWADMLKSAVPSILQLAGAGRGIAPAPVLPVQAGAPTAVPARGANPNPQQPAQPQPEGDVNLQFLNWLRSQVQGLVGLAQRGKDPELYADVLTDNLPDGANPRDLYEFLMGKEWWPTLLKFVPEAQPHMQWFGVCRRAMLENLRDMIQATAPPEPTVGNEPGLGESDAGS